MILRDYQQECSDAIIDHIRRSKSSCLVDCPTGSGKSMIVADVARRIHEMSGKKILCLAPSGELVEQNHSKYLLTGNPASLYSASVGKKSLRHDVVFGSPLSVLNNVKKFSGFAAVIIDEAHGITPTLISIIDHLKNDNKMLRVIGLSATCYRMNTGYIYAFDYRRGYLDDEETISPFFANLVYSIDARMLISEGYLTPPVFESSDNHYDTSGLTLNRTGNWDASTVDKAFIGQGRKTAKIIAEVVEKSANKKGVMIFASTIKHANEIMESLPASLSEIVTGKTSKQDRKAIIDRFKDRKIKYLVNVSVLTTGFDAPHVDHIAVLRATESAGLYQQMIGRGLRLDEGKLDCLISDYAENIDRHFPDGDVFNPEIKARKKSESQPIDIICPDCNHINKFSARPNPDGYETTSDGYFADLSGIPIEYEGQKLPSHFGRRCTGQVLACGEVSRCAHKWSFKKCEKCEHENDIAARYCTGCKNELVDPNEKLRLEAARIANDPYAIKVANVESITIAKWPGKNGKPDTVRVNFYTDTNEIIPMWLSPNSNSNWLLGKWDQFCIGVFGEKIEDLDEAIDRREDAITPRQIAYRKNKGTKYNDIISIEYTK